MRTVLIYILLVCFQYQKKSSDLGISSSKIVEFNNGVSEIASQYNIEYVDIYHLLVNDGYIKPEYTTDGVHLTDEAYQVWATEMVGII